MGTKDKFWCSRPNTDTDWLFKYPRPNTGEHWAEKVAAEVADLLGVTHARVELATFEARRGSISESFTRGGRELIHGNQVLPEFISEYDAGGKMHHSRHTLSNIWLAVERSFKSARAGEIAKRRFAAYLTLDALIGNTDRHHENWGLQRRRTRNGWRGFLAPSFDHASSLGRELQDAHRDILMTENRVGRYIERGHGGIFWSEDTRRGPSPLNLARLAADEHPALFQASKERLERIDEVSIRDIVERIPEHWMSRLERKFAIALMCYNLEELRKVFQ